MSFKIYYKVAINERVINDYLFDSPADAVEVVDGMDDGAGSIYGFKEYSHDDPTPSDKRVVFWKMDMTDARCCLGKFAA